MEVETREVFTKGYKSLGIRTVNGIEIEFFKSKTRNMDRLRFLVWIHKYEKCILVWKDRSSYYMNDVCRHNGKNWYSYSDTYVKDIFWRYGYWRQGT